MPINETEVNNSAKNVSETQTRKYRISEELAKFDSSSAAAKRAEIMEDTGIHRSTLSEWENIPYGDKRMIPYDYMMVIARILGCKAERLINA